MVRRPIPQRTWPEPSALNFTGTIGRGVSEQEGASDVAIIGPPEGMKKFAGNPQRTWAWSVGLYSLPQNALAAAWCCIPAKTNPARVATSRPATMNTILEATTSLINNDIDGPSIWEL